MKNALLTWSCLAVLGCSGAINGTESADDGEGDGDAGGEGGGASNPKTLPPTMTGATGVGVNALGAGSMTRLSKREYAATLRDLLKLPRAPKAVEILPQDVLTPFDNDAATQATSAVVIAAAQDIAREAADLALASAESRAALVPCRPSGPSDDACLRAFAKSFGRRALRRPLGNEELDELVRLGERSRAENDFFVGVRLVLEVLLQDPEFVYHVQIGERVGEGLMRLGAFEVASRLSFGLRGVGPDDALLDAAAAGKLDTAAGIRQAATQMLATTEAGELMARFHALWFGYAELRVATELAGPMQAEADALVKRIVLEQDRPWRDLLTADEAYVDGSLAKLYGLPDRNTPGWAKQAQADRRGLLGQAAFLSAGAKFGDTSPVLRGIQVRERFLCQHIAPPPPELNVDEPPKAGDKACKAQRYAIHAEAACAGCHKRIDPVGNGLEQFDAVGAFRTHELDRPDCPVSGEGEFVESGRKFKGTAELAKALAENEALDDCVASQVLRFWGRRQVEDEDGVAAVKRMFVANDRSLKRLVVELAASPAFRHRALEVNP